MRLLVAAGLGQLTSGPQSEARPPSNHRYPRRSVWQTGGNKLGSNSAAAPTRIKSLNPRNVAMSSGWSLKALWVPVSHRDGSAANRWGRHEFGGNRHLMSVGLTGHQPVCDPLTLRPCSVCRRGVGGHSPSYQPVRPSWRGWLNERPRTEFGLHYKRLDQKSADTSSTIHYSRFNPE